MSYQSDLEEGYLNDNSGLSCDHQGTINWCYKYKEENGGGKIAMSL